MNGFLCFSSQGKVCNRWRNSNTSAISFYLAVQPFHSCQAILSEAIPPNWNWMRLLCSPGRGSDPLLRFPWKRWDAEGSVFFIYTRSGHNQEGDVFWGGLLRRFSEKAGIFSFHRETADWNLNFVVPLSQTSLPLASSSWHFLLVPYSVLDISHSSVT